MKPGRGLIETWSRVARELVAGWHLVGGWSEPGRYLVEGRDLAEGRSGADQKFDPIFQESDFLRFVSQA